MHHHHMDKNRFINSVRIELSLFEYNNNNNNNQNIKATESTRACCNVMKRVE